ncbi:MAG: peptidylprolyl isomerase [Chloroflexi bacterium]|nr:peptidylprolyl isomerase [Chloroflexota bacterium]
MSQTRRVRRDAARQQAQQRLRKMLAARRKKVVEGSGLRRWPSLLLQRRSLYFLGALALVLLIAFPLVTPPPTPPPVTENPTVEVPTPAPAPSKTLAPPVSDLLAQGKRYQADVVTSKGVIRVDLLPAEAPAVVNNFVYLARQNYYTGLPVYRAEQNRRVEMGSLNPDGTGGPGYTLPVEPGHRPLDVGLLATVPQADGATGAPFMITLTDLPDPGPGHTVFGRVSDGLDLARRLQPGDKIIAVSITETEAP